MQLCWVVPDIQAAMANWTRTAGVGPFFYFDSVTFEDGLYRGKPAQIAKHEAAIAQAGDLQIELVCQASDEPSIWRELVPRDKVGFHHVALYCDDFDATLAAYTAQGAEVAYTGLMMGHRTCWIDTTATLGLMVELVTKNPVADSVFGAIRAAAENWDGTNPVRTFG
jgi:catechol 2,3-dioxygenase-like lactoylglutathione lyase family enzyme